MLSNTATTLRTHEAGATLSLFQLLDPEVLANPYPLYHRLRTQDPVHWDPYLHAWVVTRYSDVVTVLLQFSANCTPTPEQLSAIGLSELAPVAQVMVRQMLFMDAPAHTRLRGLASTAFSPARVEALRSHIQEIVNSLLDPLVHAGGMDVIADLAAPLPAIVTAEMLGVPTSDCDQLKAWSADFAEVLGNFQHNPDRASRTLRCVEEMTLYFREAIHSAQTNPGEGLINALMTAELDGDRLTEEEIIANCIVTMVGGQETTTNLIGNGVLTLLRHPDQMQRLRNDLTLIPSAVEELLRYESPSQHTARIAPQDTELGGKQIRKGQGVIAVMAAGNRDPERFPDPDRLDLSRTDNRHLAFGWASHFCFGAPLARIEGQIAFEAIVRRLPDLALEPGPLVWRENLGLRGLTSLPVRFGQTLPAVAAATKIEHSSGDCPFHGSAGSKSAGLHLSDAKRNLLEQYLRGDTRQRLASPRTITRRASEEQPHLSFAQQRLWFLEQLAPGSPVFNVPLAVRVSRSLDAAALERSLNEIVRRHEVLRTTFTTEEGQPVPFIAPNLNITLAVSDLTGYPETEREVESQRLTNEEAQRPFDLAQGSLIRATLLRLGGQNDVLLLTMHHIVFDGWSIEVLFRELEALYDAFSAGRPTPLPELPIQYTDFAVWQREWMQGDVLESQLSYWNQQLGNSPAELKLPTDRPRPIIQTYRGATQTFALSRPVTQALKTLGQREGVTLFMTLLAAFQALLSRYTGQDDIAVGTPIANRNRQEIEGLIGFFANTLVLRTNLSDDPTFRELLGRVREVSLRAYAHQDLPFAKLVEELHPQRNTSHTPLFQVMFALQNTPMAPLELSGLTLRPLMLDSGTAKFDLTLLMGDAEQGLTGSMEYSTDLFDAATIRRMLGHFQTLLEGIIADPEQCLSRLPLLTESERHQLLVEWNDTKADYPRTQCIHQLFEAQVERAPDTVAVVFEGQQLTYRELNARANQLAHYLRRCGVEPEMRVGICVERSAEMVIGLLGILKAGGAYVPLDPSYPKERLTFMLQDAQVLALLTREKLIEGLPMHGAKVIRLDADWEIITREREENLVSGATAENLAYIIYTSGSTGKPQGVSIPHRAVNRLVLNSDYVKLEPSDRVAQASNASFDAATFEIWGALLQGARLVGITKDVALSPRDFAMQIREQGITTLFLTTSLFNQLASEVPAAFGSLRHLLFGGEAVNPRWVKEVFKNGPPKRLLHVYGPTESTTFASWHLVQDNIPEGATTVPIGRPIANTQIYLLDRQLRPIPVGIPGELYIGGDGLARGYLNRPELSAEKFIANPFSDELGARLYKTGDLARYLPDGNIEFLGRRDHQVKVRGFRVELGEIEVVLDQHPAVQKSVVLAPAATAGEKRLTAYVVPHQQQGFTTSELRSFLKEKLPEYMVPAAFVRLGELPLTPNGKVDRRALPAPDSVRSELEETFVAPRDTLELQLTKTWEKVLVIRPIGVTDNFFELGGHSLLAVRLFAQIEKVFGKRLPMASLFQAPTVEQLAGILRQEGWSAPWSSLVAIQPLGSKPPFFCVHAGGGNVLFYRDLSLRLGPDQPFYGLQAQGLDGKHPRHTRIEDMAAFYIKEIRALEPEGPYFLGGSSFGGAVAFEMARQLHAQGQKVALVALFDTAGPGYPKLLPRTTRLHYGIYSIVRKVEHHLGSLLRLETGKKKITYFLEKTKKAKRITSRSIRRKRKRIARRAFGRPLPGDLRETENVIYQARKDYVPQVYAGPVTLFRASKQPLGIYPDPTLGWGRLVAGGLEIYEVPGSHGAIVSEPRVQFLVEKLRVCLDKAQATS